MTANPWAGLLEGFSSQTHVIHRPSHLVFPSHSSWGNLISFKEQKFGDWSSNHLFCFFLSFMILVIFDLSIRQKRKKSGDAQCWQVMWGSCRWETNGRLCQTTTTSPRTSLLLLLAAPRKHAEDPLTSPVGIYTEETASRVVMSTGGYTQLTNR